MEVEPYFDVYPSMVCPSTPGRTTKSSHLKKPRPFDLTRIAPPATVSSNPSTFHSQCCHDLWQRPNCNSRFFPYITTRYTYGDLCSACRMNSFLLPAHVHCIHIHLPFLFFLLFLSAHSFSSSSSSSACLLYMFDSAAIFFSRFSFRAFFSPFFLSFVL